MHFLVYHLNSHQGNEFDEKVCFHKWTKGDRSYKFELDFLENCGSEKLLNRTNGLSFHVFVNYQSLNVKESKFERNWFLSVLCQFDHKCDNCEKSCLTSKNSLRVLSCKLNVMFYRWNGLIMQQNIFNISTIINSVLYKDPR